MSWRDAFLHPRRNHEGSRPARARARGVGLETFAASEPARDDADALGLHADPDEAIYAEMAVMPRAPRSGRGKRNSTMIASA